VVHGEKYAFLKQFHLIKYSVYDILRASSVQIAGHWSRSLGDEETGLLQNIEWGDTNIMIKMSASFLLVVCMFTYTLPHVWGTVYANVHFIFTITSASTGHFS